MGNNLINLPIELKPSLAPPVPWCLSFCDSACNLSEHYKNLSVFCLKQKQKNKNDETKPDNFLKTFFLLNI